MQNVDLVQVRVSVENWLRQYTNNLELFRSPIPYAQIASSVGFSEDSIRSVIANPKLIYAVFQHTFKGKRTPSKPFALYPCDRQHCVLDWEYPLVTALERWFKARGYDARQELGSPRDISALKKVFLLLLFQVVAIWLTYGRTKHPQIVAIFGLLR